MTMWHGYPQHPDAHPARPWWHRDHTVGAYEAGLLGDAWRRIDGGAPCRAADLARYDAAHPLPPPEPRCGQVWVWPKYNVHGMVIGVDRKGHVVWSCYPLEMGAVLMEHVWPPPGAVLVAGPGAPWAPMGVERG